MRVHDAFDSDEDDEDFEDDEIFVTAQGPPKSSKDLLNELWYGYRGMARVIRDMRRGQRIANGRLSKLERFQWLLTGGILLVGAQAAIIGAIIVALLQSR